MIPVRDGNPAAITGGVFFRHLDIRSDGVLTPVIAGTNTAGSELKKL